jgi:hypothetical protein
MEEEILREAVRVDIVDERRMLGSQVSAEILSIGSVTHLGRFGMG